MEGIGSVVEELVAYLIVGVHALAIIFAAFFCALTPEDQRFVVGLADNHGVVFLSVFVALAYGLGLVVAGVASVPYNRVRRMIKSHVERGTPVCDDEEIAAKCAVLYSAYSLRVTRARIVQGMSLNWLVAVVVLGGAYRGPLRVPLLMTAAALMVASIVVWVHFTKRSYKFRVKACRALGL